MLKLLGRATSSNVQKVIWLLAEMQIPYVREDYGGEFGGNKSEEYLRLNPNGVIPTLIDDSVVLWESNTILRYLANRFGPSPLYPTDIVERAYCERWMDWQLGTLSLVMAPLYIGLVRTAAKDRDPVALELSKRRAADLFRLLDREIGQGQYLGGEDLSLADIGIGILTYRWTLLGLKTDPLPNVELWLARLASRPAFCEHVMIGLA
jgi:glutathione S-transferase